MSYDPSYERGVGPEVQRVRAICMALPGTTEKLSHGEAAWFVRGRSFANMAEKHHDDRVSVWIAAPPGGQEVLVQTDERRFFRPPYVGARGWVGVYLDVPVDWDELAGIIADAHRFIAQKR
jgi:predicted DNA-binding protein (MmcQ/YjbR family)